MRRKCAVAIVLSQIPHPTAGAVPNIETPLHMSVTPTIDPVAAPLLGATYPRSAPKDARL